MPRRRMFFSLPVLLAAQAFAQATPSETNAAPAAALWPQSGETLRVGGDLFTSVVPDGAFFRCGPAFIDTPLPDGYPAPTPAGAIDIKSYPTVRRAQVSGESNPDLGQNSAFWPLFQHIKKHDIAMTSPVEMNYPSLDRSTETPRETDWTMSFLYRSPDMNATGTEGRVVVEDLPPVTMLAIGYTGSYSVAKVDLEVEKLYQWLDSNPEYRPVGPPRAMFYNGPSTAPSRRWAEVQLPIERTTPQPMEADKRHDPASVAAVDSR